MAPPTLTSTRILTVEAQQLAGVRKLSQEFRPRYGHTANGRIRGQLCGIGGLPANGRLRRCIDHIDDGRLRVVVQIECGGDERLAAADEQENDTDQSGD